MYFRSTMANTDKKELQDLWVGWTRDAGSAYVMPDEPDDGDVDDMIDITTGYADGMLDELEKRFGGGTRARRKKKRKTANEDPEEEEEEEER